jgi:putative transcriptional regulator
MMAAAQSISKVRDLLGLNQQQFGQLVGAHWMTVSKWERGVLSPNPYQQALIYEFEKAATTRQVQQRRDELGTLLVGAGIAAALLLLLNAAANKR